MDNLVDPEAVQPPIAIGPCRCPGRPHAGPDGTGQDFVTVVRAFGYGAVSEIRRADGLYGPDVSTARAMLLGIKAWTLVLADGKPRPVDAEQIGLLDVATADRLDEIVGEVLATKDDDLPNGSGADSPSGSPASDTSIPMSPAPEPSTTP